MIGLVWYWYFMLYEDKERPPNLPRTIAGRVLALDIGVAVRYFAGTAALYRCGGSFRARGEMREDRKSCSVGTPLQGANRAPPIKIL